MRYLLAIVTSLLLITAQTPADAADRAAPLKLSIWPGQAPVGDGTTEAVEVPITVFLPAPGKATGMAAVICPGGGYGGLVVDGEGTGIARWLNGQGIAGIVLQYRLPHGRYRVPLLDAQRALRVARAHANQWMIDPGKLGIIGFSAGGHLASTAATHFDAGDPGATDPVERMSCRPDFAVLVYPVITMGPRTHAGSRTNLMGTDPSPKLIEYFSNEKQVTAQTPPVFITHARTDSVVSVENSRMFYAALKAHGVKAEYLEFAEGTHGYSGYRGPQWDGWQAACAKWLSRLQTTD